LAFHQIASVVLSEMQARPSWQVLDQNPVGGAAWAGTAHTPIRAAAAAAPAMVVRRRLITWCFLPWFRAAHPMRHTTVRTRLGVVQCRVIALVNRR
jgi:hypothetical protein